MKPETVIAKIDKRAVEFDVPAAEVADWFVEAAVKAERRDRSNATRAWNQARKLSERADRVAGWPEAEQPEIRTLHNGESLTLKRAEWARLDAERAEVKAVRRSDEAEATEVLLAVTREAAAMIRGRV